MLTGSEARRLHGTPPTESRLVSSRSVPSCSSIWRQRTKIDVYQRRSIVPLMGYSRPHSLGVWRERVQLTAAVRRKKERNILRWLSL